MRPFLVLACLRCLCFFFITFFLRERRVRVQRAACGRLRCRCLCFATGAVSRRAACAIRRARRAKMQESYGWTLTCMPFFFPRRGPDDRSIYVDANTRIQILETMMDLPTADKEQSAAFIVSPPSSSSYPPLACLRSVSAVFPPTFPFLFPFWRS